MNEFRRLATKIDQQMQYLVAQGIREDPLILNRMMGCIPDLQKIWTETTDQQFLLLCEEFPGFHRYAFIAETAFEAERNRTSRPYDGLQQFGLTHKAMGEKLLIEAGALESAYQAMKLNLDLVSYQPHLMQLEKRYKHWLSNLEAFKYSLRNEGVNALAVKYVEEAFEQFSERIAMIAAR